MTRAEAAYRNDGTTKAEMERPTEEILSRYLIGTNLTISRRAWDIRSRWDTATMMERTWLSRLVGEE